MGVLNQGGGNARLDQIKFTGRNALILDVAFIEFFKSPGSGNKMYAVSLPPSFSQKDLSYGPK